MNQAHIHARGDFADFMHGVASSIDSDWVTAAATVALALFALLAWRASRKTLERMKIDSAQALEGAESRSEASICANINLMRDTRQMEELSAYIAGMDALQRAVTLDNNQFQEAQRSFALLSRTWSMYLIGVNEDAYERATIHDQWLVRIATEAHRLHHPESPARSNQARQVQVRQQLGDRVQKWTDLIIEWQMVTWKREALIEEFNEALRELAIVLNSFDPQDNRPYSFPDAVNGDPDNF